MTKPLFALFLFLFPTFAEAAWVSGQFRNAKPGTAIELLVPLRYMEGQDRRYRGVLDAQLRFSFEANVPEPQLAFLLFNDERLTIFLSDTDTLNIKSDAFQYPLSVVFGGNAASNNRLLQAHLRVNPLDFNEFNNIRFKIGQYWTTVENAVNRRMETSYPLKFKTYLDSLRTVSIALFEQTEQQSPGGISPDFARWLNAEITYAWAYHLLVYGHVYGGRYGIQPDFYDFLYEAPLICESIGSEQYRLFLLAIVARQQAKSNEEPELFWAGQYKRAGKMLSGKPLSFFRSEIISIAFSGEKYRDLLPIYTDFLQNNEHPEYDAKVEGLYQKHARMLPGSYAPGFEVSDAHGNPVSLTQLRGKVVYLNFWASWCGACLRKMEYMDDFIGELESNGIEILNVSIDEQAANWRNALAQRQYKGRHILASSAHDRNLAVLFGVEAIPQYFIIARNGSFADKPATNQPADIHKQLLIAAKRN